MRFLWTLVKLAVALAIAIPLCIVAFAVTAGIVGTVLAVAFFALRIAFFATIAYAGYRVVRRLFGGRAAPLVRPVSELPPVDPYYQAAMRELDAEMGNSAGR